MTWPVLALILNRQGFDGTFIGLSSAGQSVAVFLALPLTPRLLARWGFIRTAATGIGVAVVMLLLLPLFPDVLSWTLIRFVLGASTVVFYTACEIWVNRLALEESRGRTIGLFGFLWSAGFTAGPLIIAWTGSEGWAPFIVAAALMAIAALPLLSMAEPPATGTDPAPAGLSAFIRFMRLAPAALAAALLLGAVDYATDAFLPLYALHHGLPQAAALALLTVLLAGYTVAHIPLRMACRRHRSPSSAPGHDRAGRCKLPGRTRGHRKPAAHLARRFRRRVCPQRRLDGGRRPDRSALPRGRAVERLRAGGILYGIGSIAGPLITGLAADGTSLAAVPFVLASFCAVYLAAAGLLRRRTS